MAAAPGQRSFAEAGVGGGNFRSGPTLGAEPGDAASAAETDSRPNRTARSERAVIRAVIAGNATGGHRFARFGALDAPTDVRKEQYGRMPTSEATRERPARPAGFIAGVTAVLSGARLVLADPELRRLTAIPIALTGVLYVALVAAVLLFSDDALGWVWPRPESAWLIPVWYLAWAAGMLSLFLISALLFTTVAEVVGGPFYERMANLILSRHGRSVVQPTFVDGTILDVVRSLLFVIPAACFALLGLLPGVGLPFTLLGGFMAWLGFGASAINPALLVSGHRFGARLSYVRQNMSTVVGFGGVVALSFSIPLLPLLAIPCSIAGATDLYGRTDR